jgi:hypothetical protein
MKLSQCNLGQIVVIKEDPKKIGHIVGLGYNYDSPDSWSKGFVIPVVKFVGEELPRKIHYGNIDIFKAY